MIEQVLIQKDKKKAKELTVELKKFQEFCKQVSKQLNGMVKEVASKQWAMGKILVENKRKIENKPEWKNLLPLFYMGVARASGQDLRPQTLEKYATFYERIPDLVRRLNVRHVPVEVYKIIALTGGEIIKQINEIEKRYENGEWKTVKEFMRWVYPEKELTAIDMVNRFHNWFGTGASYIDDFTNMNLRDLDKDDAEGLLTEIGVMAFETLPRMAKEIADETGAKPNERIARLVKLTKE